jgi:hypothetical protein
MTTCLAILFSSFAVQGPTEPIVRSLQSANVEQVAQHFDDYIDLKLLDKDEVKNMGKNQAGIALKNFFNENGVKGFEKTSEREIGNTMYMAGKLLNNAKGFNITVLMRQKAGQYQIITIRIS